MRVAPIPLAAVVVFAAAAPLCAALAAEPGVRLRLEDQGHQRPQIRERLPYEVIPPRVRFGQSLRVYSFTDPISKVARVDYTLSRLCQRGAFIQEMDGMYWAQTPDRRLGVGFSGGANLVDPQKRREKATVYFFDKQDSYCTVYAAAQRDVMDRFVAPGSRLPVLGPTGIPAPPQPGQTSPDAQIQVVAPSGQGVSPGAPPYR